MALVAPTPRWSVALVAALAVGVTACGSDDEPSPTQTEQATPMAGGPGGMVLSSPAFDEGETVPVEHTCDGADRSPPLAIDGLPDEAVSLVVLMEDPDAPGGTFDHWVGYDADVAPEVPAGTEPGTAGTNSFGRLGYGGPCPPAGDPHRYVFTVLALDSELGLDEGESKGAVLDAAQDHTLAEASLTGLYGR